MAWSSQLLSTGSRDRSILHRDVRAPDDFTAKLQAHRSEVRLPIAPPHAASPSVDTCEESENHTGWQPETSPGRE